MQLLYWFESIRNPVLDMIMSTVTHFGEELVFMILAIIMLWCVNKWEGYYLLSVGLIGTQLNQLLKITFRIERPWVRDPHFKPIASAVPEATGYSFPSGHTQSAVGSFGALARWNNAWWLRIVCAVICVAVPISRMYLGVHTPLDVGVSFVLAILLVFGLYPLFRKAEHTKHGMRLIIIGMMVISLAMAIYTSVTLWGTTQPELYSALKNAYKMLGATAGFWVVYELDVHFIHFETRAVWWAQILKVAIGLALLLGVKELSYVVFDLFCGELVTRLLSYFVIVLFAGAIWPLTFRWFAKLGKTA